LRVQVLRELFLGEPLEVLQVLGVDGQIGLAGHNARLQEEDLASGSLDGSCFALLRAGRVERVPSDGVVADHPGVHVDTGGFGKGALSSLVNNRILA
jgi:hypothetical protein